MSNLDSGCFRGSNPDWVVFNIGSDFFFSMFGSGSRSIHPNPQPCFKDTSLNYQDVRPKNNKKYAWKYKNHFHEIFLSPSKANFLFSNNSALHHD